MVSCKEKKDVIFNDKALKLLLKSDIGRRYSALIISFLTKENLHSLENNLIPYSEEIALTTTSIDSTADVVLKYFETFYNIEVNNFYGKVKQVQIDSYKYQLFLKKLKSFKDYKKMTNIYQISIDAKDIFHDNNFTYQIVRKDLESNKELPYDFIKDYHINLAYLRTLSYNEIVEKQGLERYLYFLVCDDEEFLKELYEGDVFMNEVIRKARLIAGKDKLDLYYIPDDAIRRMDEELYLEEGFNNGFNNGYNKGINEKQNEVILNMYHDNVPVEKISEYTKLSCEEVNKVIKEKESM